MHVRSVWGSTLCLAILCGETAAPTLLVIVLTTAYMPHTKPEKRCFVAIFSQSPQDLEHAARLPIVETNYPSYSHRVHTCLMSTRTAMLARGRDEQTFIALIRDQTIRLHLGFSAKLSIWQVSACKREPQNGIIFCKRRPNQTQPPSSIFLSMLCGVPTPNWQVCMVSPDPEFVFSPNCSLHQESMCGVPPPRIHFSLRCPPHVVLSLCHTQLCLGI